MSGSGKTALARQVVARLRSSGEAWLLVDGDRFRAMMGEDLGHTVADRRRMSERLMNLSREYAAQNLNVLVCVLSIFPEHQASNRQQIPDYREVYLKVPMEVLRARDNKKLYEKALAGAEPNVVGVDIPFPEPPNPDLVLENSETLTSLEPLARRMLEGLGLPGAQYRYASQDRISRPEKYAYAPFFGHDFLDAYEHSRASAIVSLGNRLERLAATFPPDGDAPFGSLVPREPGLAAMFRSTPRFSDVPSSGQTRTADFLTTLLTEDAVTEVRVQELLRLLQRFEVSKRIYAAYDRPLFKAASADFSELRLYGLFGLALLRAARETESRQREAIFLNAMLKNGDILSSALHRYALPEEIWLGHAALTGELAAIRDYRRRHGL